MINRDGKQPDPGLLMEEEDELYGPGYAYRPVEVLRTTLDAPLGPDAFEHEPRKPCTPIPCSPAEPE